MRFVVGAVLVAFVFEKSDALRCWKCSSDIDPTCRDPFREYGSSSGSNSYDRNRQSSVYDNLQNNYNQRQYDNNYNSRYDPRYDNNNRDSNSNYNPSGVNYNNGYQNAFNRVPTLEICDENEARNRRMRNVCLKEIVRGSNYVSVVRRCEMVPYEQTAGTCSQTVSRGLLLDFCEYCDYDGCNSATGIKTNFYLAAAITTIVVFLTLK